MARHDGFRIAAPQIEEIVAALPPYIQDVAEPLGHYHRGWHALALDNGVRDEGCSVYDRADLMRRDARRLGETRGTFDHGLGWVVGRGQLLVCAHRPRSIVKKREVGERSANIYADAIAEVRSSRHCAGHPDGLFIRRVVDVA